MDRQKSEGRMQSPRSLPHDDVVQLIEHWVQEFERDGDELSPDASAQAVETMWSDRSRHAVGDTQKEPSQSSSSRVRIKSEELPLKLSGLLATFTDRIGGSVSLSQKDGRLQHRGTIAVRGRCASVEAASGDISLPDHVTRAFEFVAFWFGFPFDSANLRTAARELLSWGFWGLSGAELVGCLQQWKRQAPDAFESYAGAFGVDVLDGPILRVQSDGRSVDGRSAEWAIATEPRLLAVLARFGRDPAAQKAQLNTVLANWVTPVMSQSWDPASGRECLTVDTLKSAKHIAALLYLVRRHGRRAAMQLVHSVNERYHPQDDEEAWLAALVRSLTALGRAHDSCEVLRIASSMELTTA